MSDDGEGLQAGNHDGKYELFTEVDNTVREEIKELVFNGELSSDSGFSVTVTGCQCLTCIITL